MTTNQQRKEQMRTIDETNGVPAPETVTTPAAPKKRKPRATKKANEIKDAMEQRQVGAEPEADKPKRGRPPKRQQQTEMAGVIPPPDKVGVAAQRFKEAVVAATDAADEKAEVQDNLIKALRNAKRYNFSCDGYKFEMFHHGAKDTIKVTNPK